MVCNSCGRNNENQSARFCENCGASLKEGNVQESEPTYNYSYQSERENTSASTPPHSQAIDIREDKKPVSFGNWLGTYFIMLIPAVGWLVFLIMLFVWAFSDGTPESKKNWARATLVFVLIMFVLSLLVALAFLSMFRSPLFQEIFNNEMNQYNDIFKDFRY